MFGGLTDLKNNTGMDFGERMLNSVATQSLRHLFSQSESVDVEIRCQPASKLLQGTIDGFKMEGKGLVIRRQFRADVMSFETDAVALDLGALFGGNLRLRQPTNAIARVILSEPAINEAFEADLVQKRLVGVTHPRLLELSGGEPVSFRDVSVTLLPQARVEIRAKTDLPNRSDIDIALQAQLKLERRKRLTFDQAEFLTADIEVDNQGLSEVMTSAFVDVLNDMVDFDRFNLDGVMLRVNRLETQGKTLVFSGYAQIDHMPRVG